MTPVEMESLARTLEASGHYRVLRRFQRVGSYGQRTLAADAPPLSLGLMIDLETTGLEEDAKPIELSAVQFEFDHAGGIYTVRPLFTMLEDPGFPLAEEIRALTGITDEQLAGQRFNDAVVNQAIGESDLVLAFNAKFDRPISERRFPKFINKHWACGRDEVPWDLFGARGKYQLDYLLETICGEFYEGHRATNDCEVALHLLARPAVDRNALPVSLGDLAPYLDGTRITPFQILLTGLRRITYRLFAIDTPYPKKDVLKRRHYRWSDGSNGSRKAWYIDLKADQVEPEKGWLQAEVYQSPRPNIFVAKVSAKDRYSNRV